MSSFIQLFWDERFWLPISYTWDDFTPTESVPKPKLSDLHIVPLLTVVILIARFIFEKFIATPICVYWIGDRLKRNIEQNDVCEKVFCRTPEPSEDSILKITEQLKWSRRKVERWFFKRQRIINESLLKKARESCWKFCVHSGFFLYGCFTLLPTDWFYNSDQWVQGFIREQPFTSDFKWYYVMELSYYNSHLCSHFFDTRRKDFWPSFIHHIATVIPIFGSLMNGHFRVGVVIMFLHDASDIWLEAAKITNYTQTKIMKIRACDVLFFIFAAIFFLTRWVYYPLVVLRYAIYTVVNYHGPFPSHIIITVLLFVLQLLHLYWGFLVGKLAWIFIGDPQKDHRDIRSEDEEEEDENEESNNNVNNGDAFKKTQ